MACTPLGAKLVGHTCPMSHASPQRGRDANAGESPSQPAPAQTLNVLQRACRSAWARLIAKVYEIDPLICPRCGSEMKLIALITNPSEVAAILRHLIKIGRAPPGLDPNSLN